jgi:hypothetical protein
VLPEEGLLLAFVFLVDWFVMCSAGGVIQILIIPVHLPEGDTVREVGDSAGAS